MRRRPIARPRQVATASILETAREVFLEHGPAASTVEIARRVGLSQAALFKRFGTKQDLLMQALAPPKHPPFLAMLAEGPADAPVGPQLLEIGRQIASFFRFLVPCLAVLRATGVDHHKLIARYDDPPPVKAHRALARWIRQAQELGRVRADADVEASALVFLGALQSRAFLTHLLGDDHALDLDDDRYLRNLVDVLCNGIHGEDPA